MLWTESLDMHRINAESRQSNGRPACLLIWLALHSAMARLSRIVIPQTGTDDKIDQEKIIVAPRFSCKILGHYFPVKISN